jgi:hypothetical protein
MTLYDHTGKAIRLPDERLRHFSYRVDYAGLEDRLQETLLNPDLVIQSNWDETVSLSYRFYRGTRIGDKWLCIVVKHDGEDAFVLTAYPTDRLKEGTLIWKKT